MRFSTSCEETCRKIASDAYAESTWWQRLIVRIHLLSCGDCRCYERQMRVLGDSARRLADAAEPDVADLQRLGNAILTASLRRAEDDSAPPDAD